MTDHFIRWTNSSGLGASRYYVLAAFGKNPWKVEKHNGIRKGKTSTSFTCSKPVYFKTLNQANDYWKRGNDRLKAKGSLYNP